MRVTVCQLEPEAATAADQLAGLVDHMAATGSDFLLLPEMPFSPWLAADPGPDPVRWAHAVEATWLAGGRAVAVCSGAYCLSSNLSTTPRVAPNCGGVGWIIDPDGEVLATTSEDDPFVTVEVDLEVSRRSKLTYPRYVPE